MKECDLIEDYMKKVVDPVRISHNCQAIVSHWNDVTVDIVKALTFGGCGLIAVELLKLWPSFYSSVVVSLCTCRQLKMTT